MADFISDILFGGIGQSVANLSSEARPELLPAKPMKGP